MVKYFKNIELNETNSSLAYLWSLTEGTKKVVKAGIKGGVKLASAIIRGTRAANRVYNNHYNTSILDSSGKVITRYHDATSWGEVAIDGLLNP